MALDLVNYEEKARDAVKLFWSTREAAKDKQAQSGKTDQGERSGATGGKNMDGFVRIAVDLVRANGLDDAHIYLQRTMLTLPGYFRPTKLWDLLVVRRHRLIAALEFKSQVGPSFGNNANNRAEEAIGSGADLWTAYREGAFGQETPAPFVGFFFLLEDAPESRSPVHESSTHFPVFPEFEGISYADRYNILCTKLVQQRLYTAASVIMTSRTQASAGTYSELSELTGLQPFVAGLAGHIATEASKG